MIELIVTVVVIFLLATAVWYALSLPWITPVMRTIGWIIFLVLLAVYLARRFGVLL